MSSPRFAPGGIATQNEEHEVALVEMICLLNLADIADVGLPLSSRGRQLQFFVCGIKSEGNRRGRSRKKSASDTPVEEDEKLRDSIPVKKSSGLSSNEEILALFRRIQSSISKGERVVRKKRNTRKDSQSPKRVTDAQRQDSKQKQVGDTTSRRSTDQQPPQQRETSSKDENIANASASESLKPSRPPSNFVKRSPIPPALLPRESATQVVGEELPAMVTEDTPGAQKIDGLKLSELKELAKSRGVKGYSKLKKDSLKLNICCDLGQCCRLNVARRNRLAHIHLLALLHHHLWPVLFLFVIILFPC